jgi:hypothetical protein
VAGIGRGVTVFHSVGVRVLSTARQVQLGPKNSFGTGQLNHGRSASRQQVTFWVVVALVTSRMIQSGMSSGLGKKVNVFWPAQM